MWPVPIFIKYLDPPLQKFSLQLYRYTRFPRVQEYEFSKISWGLTEPLLRPLPLLNLGLRPRFGLRSQFSGVSRLLFRLCPQYSSGASCLGSGINLDSPMFISSLQGRSPPDPYSVSVFKKLIFSHFNHLLSILTRMWAQLEPSFLIKTMQICTKKAWITT